MKKAALFILVLPFLTTQAAFAESRASVKINNNVNSNSNSQVTSETNIRINTNGKETIYSSDKPENVEINVVNGESEIKVNGASVSQTPAISASPTPTSQPSNGQKEIEDKQDLIKMLEEIFNKVFSLFG